MIIERGGAVVKDFNGAINRAAMEIEPPNSAFEPSQDFFNDCADIIPVHKWWRNMSWENQFLTVFVGGALTAGAAVLYIRHLLVDNP